MLDMPPEWILRTLQEDMELEERKQIFGKVETKRGEVIYFTTWLDQQEGHGKYTSSTLSGLILGQDRYGTIIALQEMDGHFERVGVLKPSPYIFGQHIESPNGQRTTHWEFDHLWEECVESLDIPLARRTFRVG